MLKINNISLGWYNETINYLRSICLWHEKFVVNFFSTSQAAKCNSLSAINVERKHPLTMRMWNLQKITQKMHLSVTQLGNHFRIKRWYKRWSRFGFSSTTIAQFLMLVSLIHFKACKLRIAFTLKKTKYMVEMIDSSFSVKFSDLKKNTCTVLLWRFKYSNQKFLYFLNSTPGILFNRAIIYSATQHKYFEVKLG